MLLVALCFCFKDNIIYKTIGQSILMFCHIKGVSLLKSKKDPKFFCNLNTAWLT